MKNCIIFRIKIFKLQVEKTQITHYCGQKCYVAAKKAEIVIKKGSKYTLRKFEILILQGKNY